MIKCVNDYKSQHVFILQRVDRLHSCRICWFNIILMKMPK